MKMDPIDRLSPLTSVISMGGIADPFSEFEKCIKSFESPTILRSAEVGDQLFSQLPNTHPNARRHTVGPGDVAHEQALGNPVAVNFKFGVDVGTNLPINLPKLQNQPLHNFTIKDQHLLKPPTVMGASK